MIIDAHCHAGTGEGLSHPSNTDADLSRYARRARAAGIDRTIVFATLTTDDYRSGNAQVGAIVRRDPARYIGFVFVNPAYDRGRVGTIVDEAIRGWGCRGIKVHWTNGRITREVLEIARVRRLPVLYDPRGDISTVELILGSYPQVPIIIPHLGSFAGDWGSQVAIIDKLRRHPNLFVDSSGVQYFDLLVDVVRRGGPDRLIFGTDGPFLHPAVELAKIRELRLPPEQFALVTSQTILRLLPPPAVPRGAVSPGAFRTSGGTAGTLSRRSGPRGVKSRPFSPSSPH
ncbi:amidohydrolase family protein [Leifsonia sp. NPDC077715]|uniref:amidohydrolase family protein n=1 Tax=Leifsonia sp. NPDC077715 TaxID=3155539 RepID=UPI003429498B